MPYGHKKRDQYFRVTDEYTLFYLDWIAEFAEQHVITLKNTAYWAGVSNTPAWYNWAGYAFENFCLKHIDHIMRALGIEHIPCKIGSWRHAPPRKSPELEHRLIYYLIGQITLSPCVKLNTVMDRSPSIKPMRSNLKIKLKFLSVISIRISRLTWY